MNFSVAETLMIQNPLPRIYIVRAAVGYLKIPINFGRVLLGLSVGIGLLGIDRICFLLEAIPFPE